MTLTEKVSFTAQLQKNHTVQAPKLIRWRFKLDNNQPLKIGVNFLGQHKNWQFFYTKMRKDGRITIPKLILSLFENQETSLTGTAAEITLEPA
jgi:hypothetical protein